MDDFLNSLLVSDETAESLLGFTAESFVSGEYTGWAGGPPIDGDPWNDLSVDTDSLLAGTSAAGQPSSPPLEPPGSPVVAEVESPPAGPVEFETDDEEGGYAPMEQYSTPAASPDGRQPIYPAYAGYFTTSEDARVHRRRARIAPKLAADAQRVRRYGREYWVRRLYEAMIDISNFSDGLKSAHRKRFSKKPVFHPADLEAVAHHIFDNAVAVHLRGWNRQVVYHKKVIRGKLEDTCKLSVESRLHRLCMVLQSNKAAVNDAMRGGTTLALLCDNPDARMGTKDSNTAGNKKRGERLKVVTKIEKKVANKIQLYQKALDAQAALPANARPAAIKNMEKRVASRKLGAEQAHQELVALEQDGSDEEEEEDPEDVDDDEETEETGEDGGEASGA